MEKYANRRNVILGIKKAHYNIVKTGPSNVNCGNINAIAMEPTHAWSVQRCHHLWFFSFLLLVLTPQGGRLQQMGIYEPIGACEPDVSNHSVVPREMGDSSESEEPDVRGGNGTTHGGRNLAHWTTKHRRFVNVHRFGVSVHSATLCWLKSNMAVLLSDRKRRTDHGVPTMALLYHPFSSPLYRALPSTVWGLPVHWGLEGSLGPHPQLFRAPTALYRTPPVL